MGSGCFWDINHEFTERNSKMTTKNLQRAKNAILVLSKQYTSCKFKIVRIKKHKELV